MYSSILYRFPEAADLDVCSCPADKNIFQPVVMPLRTFHIFLKENKEDGTDSLWACLVANLNKVLAVPLVRSHRLVQRKFFQSSDFLGDGTIKKPRTIAGRTLSRHCERHDFESDLGRAPRSWAR